MRLRTISFNFQRDVFYLTVLQFLEVSRHCEKPQHRELSAAGMHIGGHDLAARNWSVASVAHLDGLDLTAGLTLTGVSRVFRTEPAPTQIDAPTLTV